MPLFSYPSPNSSVISPTPEPSQPPDPLEKFIGSSGFVICLVGLPFIIMILVIGLPWYHYSRKNRREAREKAARRGLETEFGGLNKTNTGSSGSGSSGSGGDEEANVGIGGVGYGGKAELDGRSKEEQERDKFRVKEGVCELEQPGIPEVDGEGTRILELWDGSGVAVESGGWARCELEGCGVGMLGEERGKGDEYVNGKDIVKGADEEEKKMEARGEEKREERETEEAKKT